MDLASDQGCNSGTNYQPPRLVLVVLPAQLVDCSGVTNWWLFLCRMLCITHGLRALWLCPFQERAHLPGDNDFQLAASPRGDDPLGLCQVRP
jgi:hypothetical protein